MHWGDAPDESEPFGLCSELLDGDGVCPGERNIRWGGCCTEKVRPKINKILKTF